MPKPFAITAASNSVFLDEDRQGETSFTVSNQSGRSIRGQARLVADKDEVLSWLKLRGQPEREFATAGTERYTVDISVPSDIAAGSHTFGLDMVGERRPDEQYVEGPTVTFQVPERKETQPFPWKIVAAIAAVLLIGGGLLAYVILSDSGEPDTVAVPDVAGLTVAQATDSLQSAGFEAWDLREENNDSVAAGRVIGTDPVAQTEIATDRTILLRQSTGPVIVAVPPVQNAPLLEAMNLLNEFGLTPTALSAENHSSIPVNHATRTNPAAGAEVPEGAEITLFVSLGPSNSGGGFNWEDLPISLEEFNGQVFSSQFVQAGDTIQLNQSQLQQNIEQLQENPPNP